MLAGPAFDAVLRPLAPLVLLIAETTGWAEATIRAMPMEDIDIYARVLLKRHGIDLDAQMDFDAPSNDWRDNNPELVAQIRAMGAKIE